MIEDGLARIADPSPRRRDALLRTAWPAIHPIDVRRRSAAGTTNIQP
jgi:hypothetical protein